MMDRSTHAPDRRARARATKGLALLCAAALTAALASAPAQAAGAPEAPTTQAPSAISAGGATLHGTLNPGAGSEKLKYYFLYSATPTCTEGGFDPSEFPLPEAEGNHKQVAIPLTGLEGNTKYTVCLVAEGLGEEAETTVGTQVDFTTSPAAPAIVSESAAGVTPSAASLQAEVNPENQATTACEFEYGLTPAYGTVAACQPAMLEGGSVASASAPLTGLQPDTTYYYRVVAANATGTSEGANQQFTTIGQPLVSTGAASEVTRTSALLSGTIDPQRGPSKYHFLYIDQAGYEAALAQGSTDPYAEGAITAQRELPAGEGSQAIQALPALGLLPDTTYHYALVASNSAGAVTGADRAFTTGPATPPLAATGPVREVTLGTATLTGTVDTQGLATSYAFEVSTDSGNLGSPTGAGAIDNGIEETDVTLRLQGLVPGTVYYYRVLATSLDGTGYGAVQTFTTPAAASALTPPVAQPLIGTPAIAFPTEAAAHSKVVSKKLTRKQKLAAALRVCKRQSKQRRASCRQRAHKRYGPKRASKK
jgi:hypothetical protein